MYNKGLLTWRWEVSEIAQKEYIVQQPNEPNECESIWGHAKTIRYKPRVISPGTGVPSDQHAEW